MSGASFTPGEQLGTLTITPSAIPAMGTTIQVRVSNGYVQAFATQNGRVVLDMNGVYDMAPADAEAVARALRTAINTADDLREEGLI